MTREYVRLLIDREGDANYTLYGLPEGNDSQDVDAYETFAASRLSVNGIGFGTQGAVFSQHNETVVVEQETEGGAANIKL